MTTFDDVYKSMLLKRGGNVNNSDIRNSKDSINREFKNDPSYKLAILKKRDNNEETELDTRIVNIDTNTKKKKIYVRPDTNIEVGDYIKYPNKTYLTLEVEDNLISSYASATECNNTFKWMYKGTLHNACGVGTNQTKYTLGTDAIVAGIVESDSRYNIDFPNNLNCKTIGIGQRFIFNGGAWKVTQVEYVSSQGAIRSILLGQDSLNTEIDDIENEIANSKHDYNITLNSNIESLQETGTYQINASVKDNGVIITNPNITYLSSDKTIATVSDKGIVSAIKIGNAIITATIGNVSSELNITVIAKISQNVVSYGYSWSNGLNLNYNSASTLVCTKNVNGVADSLLKIEYLFDTNGQALIDKGLLVITVKSGASIQIRNKSTTISSVSLTVKDSQDVNKTVILNENIKLLGGV